MALFLMKLLLVHTFIASSSYGAQIVHVGPTFVIVDAGTDHGLAKGDEVCLKVSASMSPPCAKVAAVRARVAGLKLIPPPTVKIGDKVVGKTLVDDGTKKASKAEIKEFIASIAKHENKTPEKTPQQLGDPRITRDRSKSSHTIMLFLGYLYTPFLPYQHRVPRYEIDRQIERNGSLWSPDLKVRSTVSGFQGGILYPVSPVWSGMVTWKYRTPFKDALEVDYDPTDETVFAKISTKTSSYGLSLGGAHKIWASPWMDVLGSGGLDFDRSNVAVNVVSEGGSESALIASLNGMLTVTSLKLGGVATIPLLRDNAGVGIHSHLLLPFHEIRQVTGNRQNLRPEVSNEQRQSSPKDLESALGHKRTTFGFEIGVNAFYKW